MSGCNTKIRDTLARVFALADLRAEINRELRARRADLRALLKLEGAEARKSRRAGKQGGQSKRTKARRVPMGETIRAKTAESKCGEAYAADAERLIREVAETFTRPVREAYARRRVNKYGLRPCPFCGSHDVQVVEGDYVATDFSNLQRRGLFGVECIACDARMGQENQTLEDVIEAWNERHSEEAEAGK